MIEINYSPSEVEYIIDRYNREPVKDIALALGRTQASIYSKMYKLQEKGKIPEIKKYKRYTTTEIGYIIENYGPMTAAEIAINLGRTLKAIERTIARLKANDRYHHHELV